MIYQVGQVVKTDSTKVHLIQDGVVACGIRHDTWRLRITEADSIAPIDCDRCLNIEGLR